MNKSSLPPRPFDGQRFIDAARVVWTFSSENDAWLRTGTEPTIPVATDTQPGLLSAHLKALIDTIPPKGGGFGIVAKPLLRVAPLIHDAVLKGTVNTAFKTEAGSNVKADSALNVPFDIDEFAGKLFRFTTGIFRNRSYLIAGNTVTEIKLLSDVSMTKIGDKFEIIEPTALNLNGIIAGNIELVSESLDISCVDSNGDPIPEDCVTPPCGDTPETMPAIDFRVSDIFKALFCAQQPGCIGPRGKTGDDGKGGKDGTGDGPTGLPGDTGVDAPQTPFSLDGIKINDINDVYDTAIVAFDIDAENARLNVVKAKIKTPDNNVPATQLIASEIFRDVDFTGDGFSYNIIMPPGDPVGTADIPLVHYPQGYEVSETQNAQKPTTTTVNTIPISDFLNEVSTFWQKKLNAIGEIGRAHV